MANNKKRVLSLLMAVMMMLTALPMNAFAISFEDLGTLVCAKEVVGHTEECYVHTEDCYHKHSEPVYDLIFGKLVYGCEYDCTEHTHSVENGCPVDNCDAHGHSANCCDVEVHTHGLLCNELKQVCSHGWQVWKCSDSCYTTVLVCGKDEHDHSADCNYACGISTEHTHDADCYSCTTTEHTHDELCQRTCGMSTESIDPIKCNDATLLLHTVNCTNELHHTHSAACYLPGDAVRDAFYKATGVEIQSAEELAAVVSTLLSCKSGCGYEVVSVLPEFVIEMVLCEEHFCTVCRRLNDGYCACVELTFANIYNDPANSVTVKVAEGTAAGAVAPHAELADYEFLGWFDASGNLFDAAAIYTEDTTFTASYRALGEIEKLQNTINFIKNNFDLGTEIGRAITLLSNGEITKEKVLSEKSAAVASLTAALLGSVVTGNITMEQAKEIGELMNQGDEYVVMVAEWLWPENAAMMPTIEEILAGVDFDKLSAEIKDMIAQKYGVEFDENWVENNKALADQYIRDCLAEAKSITEAQKAAILDQIANKKECADQIVSSICAKIRDQIASEIENAQNAANAILADREMGLKIGKTISRVTGLNNQKATEKGVLVQGAIAAAIRMSSMDADVKDALIALIYDGENGMKRVINWLWPVCIVNFVVEGVIVETDTAEYGAMPSFDGAEPTKAADAQYTYTFAGWDAAFAPVTGNVTYTATFTSTANEYAVTFVNEDGTLLQSGSALYGETPVYTGAEPTKAADAQYTYTFAGWDNEIAPVTGNVTYTATFTSAVNEFTVIFLSDGQEIGRETVEYGKAAAGPAATSLYKEGYWFEKWDADTSCVTGDMTVNAVWQIMTFTVTWKNIDGTVLEVDNNVPYGSATEYNGVTPEWDNNDEYNYTFSHFQGTTTKVSEDLELYAAYSKALKEYTVTFVYDGNEIKKVTVQHGNAATAPVATDMPIIKNFTFDKWDTDFSNVTGDMTVTALYKRTHNDSWKMKVGIGYAGVSASDSTAGFIPLGFVGTIYDAKVFESFTNWPKSTVMNATDYSGYEVKEGAMDQVKWNDVVYYNETGVQNPTHEDYFQIYKVELVATRGEYHMDNHATFYHTVTFVVDGKEYKVPVVHGTAVALPEGIDLSKEGYTFKGWDVDFTAEGFVVDKSMTITAEFEINKYTVTFWLPTGGKETRVVEHGSLLEEFVPKCPAGQYFIHWYGKGDVKLDYTQPITKNVYFNAKCGWTIEDREVKLFANLNGEEIAMGIAIYEDFYHARKFSDKVLKESQYDASKIIMPEFGTYMVGGTEYAYGAESGASDFYTVEFNKLRSWQHGGYTYHYYGEMTLFHTVYFNVNGQLISVVVEHGAAAEAPVVTKDGYTLTWSADFSNVTKTMLVTANWVKK